LRSPDGAPTRGGLPDKPPAERDASGRGLWKGRVPSGRLPKRGAPVRAGGREPPLTERAPVGRKGGRAGPLRAEAGRPRSKGGFANGLAGGFAPVAGRKLPDGRRTAEGADSGSLVTPSFLRGPNRAGLPFWSGRPPGMSLQRGFFGDPSARRPVPGSDRPIGEVLGLKGRAPLAAGRKLTPSRLRESGRKPPAERAPLAGRKVLPPGRAGGRPGLRSIAPAVGLLYAGRGAEPATLRRSVASRASGEVG
jgi:hypothetical protein